MKRPESPSSSCAACRRRRRRRWLPVLLLGSPSATVSPRRLNPEASEASVQPWRPWSLCDCADKSCRRRHLTPSTPRHTLPEPCRRFLPSQGAPTAIWVGAVQLQAGAQERGAGAAMAATLVRVGFLTDALSGAICPVHVSGPASQQLPASTGQLGRPLLPRGQLSATASAAAPAGLLASAVA